MATVTIRWDERFSLVVDTDPVEATEIAAAQAARGREVALDLRDQEDAA